MNTSRDKCKYYVIKSPPCADLLKYLVRALVVAGHGDYASKCDAQGVEGLSCSIHPHLQQKHSS